MQITREKDQRSEYYWSQVRKFGAKYQKFDWPSVEVLLNLIYTYDRVSVHFSKLMRDYGLSLPVFNILMILSRSERKGLKQQEISKLLLVSRANVTGLMNGLLQKGLVKRMPNKKDRRAWLVSLTPKGESLLETYLPEHYAEIYRIFRSFNAKEKMHLSQLMSKLRSFIQ